MLDPKQRLFLVRESAKRQLLRQLHRRGFDITRTPFSAQLQRILETHGIRSVLDVGANIGQYAHGLRDNGFPGRIVSCEPQTAAFGALVKEASQDPNWEAVHTAVGAAESVLTINISANSYSSSFLPTSNRHLDVSPASRVVATEEVSVTTVDTLIDQHSLSARETMLKVDTQGYEDIVLDGARDALSELAVVALELSMVELYAGQQLFRQMLTRMNDSGFGLYALDPAYADPKTGQMLWADGIFVRET